MIYKLKHRVFGKFRLSLRERKWDIFHIVVAKSLSRILPLWPHGQQHTRLLCPFPSPRACSNSCPSSQWWHPTILSSVTPFSSCLQSFPVSGSFLMSRFFPSGGQSSGASASASVLPMNIQHWFPLGFTGLIYLQSNGLSSLLQHHNSRVSIL